MPDTEVPKLLLGAYIRVPHADELWNALRSHLTGKELLVVTCHVSATMTPFSAVVRGLEWSGSHLVIKMTPTIVLAEGNPVGCTVIARLRGDSGEALIVGLTF